MGEAAITATCYPLAAYQVSKQNEGKAMVGTFSLRSICLLLLYSSLDSNYCPSGMYMFGIENFQASEEFYFSMSYLITVLI